MVKPYLMFLKSCGNPSRHHGSFNTKSWSNDWNDLGYPPRLWKPKFISPMGGDLLTYQQLLWYCGSLFFASWVELQLNLSLVDLHHQSWDPPVSWQFLSLANMWLPTENVEITNHINHYGYKWVLTTHTWRAWSGVLTPVETRWSPQSKLNPAIHLFEYQRMQSWGGSHSDLDPAASACYKLTTYQKPYRWTAHVLQFPSCPKHHTYSDTHAVFHGANKSQSWTFDLGSRSFAWSFSVAIAQVCFNGLSTGLLLLRNGTGYVEGEIGWY